MYIVVVRTYCKWNLVVNFDYSNLIRNMDRKYHYNLIDANSMLTFIDKSYSDKYMCVYKRLA